MTDAELIALISTKPPGVVGVVVAKQQHAEVARYRLLRTMESL